MDLCDFYRGRISPRRLEVLIRQLPRDAALVTAMKDGRPVWSPTDHLLADIWAALIRVNSEKGSLPDDFDHPVRAEMEAKAKADGKRALRAWFLRRKQTMNRGR